MPTSTRTRFWANGKEDDELSVSDADARLVPSSPSRFSTSSSDEDELDDEPLARPRPVRRSGRPSRTASYTRSTRQQAAAVLASLSQPKITTLSRRQSLRPKLSAPKLSEYSATDIATTATAAPRTRRRKRSPSPSDDEYDNSDADEEVPVPRGRSLSRSRSPSRSRSRSLSIIPTVDSPPLTFPAPEDAAVRALGLIQSARPGAATLTLERDHIIRMREGHLARARPPRTKDENRNWKNLTLSEAAWARLEEVGCVNKGRAWTTHEGYDENGEPVKPDLPYVMLTKLVIASSPRKMLTLNQIYQAMEERWPYFRNRGQTFRNSIRHNLSMNPAFVNVERPMSEGGLGTGKGGYWKVSDDVTTSHRGRGKKPRLDSPEDSIDTPSAPASFEAKRYVSLPHYAYEDGNHGPAYGRGNVETAQWAPTHTSPDARMPHGIPLSLRRDSSASQYIPDMHRRNSTTSDHYRRNSVASWQGSYPEARYSPSQSLPRAMPSPYLHTPGSSPTEMREGGRGPFDYSRRGSLERAPAPSLRDAMPPMLTRLAPSSPAAFFDSKLPTPPYEHCGGLMQLAQAAHPLAKVPVPRHSHDGYFPPHPQQHPTRLPGVSALLNPPLSPESQGSNHAGTGALCR